MPRYVRPAWIIAGADGRRSDVGLGPRGRDAFAWCRVTVRTATGAVSDEITMDAGGCYSAPGAHVRPAPNDGSGRFALSIPASFTIETETDSRGTFHVLARPREDRDRAHIAPCCAECDRRAE